jgi:sulfate adenylyltransferase subunit 1 (EFTu-like GTPase family)
MDNTNIVVVGCEGHGRKTIIQRLVENIQKSGSFPKNVLQQCKDDKKKGSKLTELSFARSVKDDTLKENVIELQAGWRTLKFFIPSNYQEFIAETVTGHFESDTAMLVIDASKDLLLSTYIYAYLISLLGIKDITVVINKMDLKQFSRIHFWELSEQISEFFECLNIKPAAIIPICALFGDNITRQSDKMRWDNNAILSESLNYFSSGRNLSQFPLRFLVESRHVTNNQTKILGKVLSGTLFEGQPIIFGPYYHSTVVQSIEISEQKVSYATAGRYVFLELENTSYIEQGQIGFNICRPPLARDFILGKVFWTSEEFPQIHDEIEVLCGNRCIKGEMELIARGKREISNEANSYAVKLIESKVSDIKIRLDSPICIDVFENLPMLGKFAIAQEEAIIGGGVFR